MSEQQSESDATTTEASAPSFNVDDVEVIIERQLQIVRRLNDELLRTTRTQVLIGAGLVTLISLIDARLFLPQTQNPLWVVGFTITFLSFLAWYNHVGAARVSYTDLQLGVHSDIGENIPAESADPPSTLTRIRTFLSQAAVHLPVVILTFAGGSLTTAQFEEDIDRDDASRLVAADAVDGIHHNNRVLRTRERYVNAVRGYLTWTFLVMLTGVLLMVFY
ncbi:hypothetical protein [Halorarum halobium]|uniref:hypothetical protein n=1 Tax=Halorarum halobium TaxID=3075121 RepID=UPI0028A83818|nr:hypothetical protein [Halobaculum sp. XH14]